MTTTATAAVCIPAPVHLAAANSGSTVRYAPEYVATYTAKGRTVLAATNGKMLSIVPTTSVDVPDGRTLISREAIKSAKRTKKNPAPILHLTDTGTYNPATGVTYPGIDCTYPPVADVFPKGEALAGRTVIRLNAALLADLAASMGTENGGVTIIVDPTNHNTPMVVLPAECESTAYATGAVGLLMPLTSNRKPDAVIAEAMRRSASVTAIVNAATA